MYRLVFSLLILLLMATSTDAQSLTKHTWKDRVLLVFSPSQQTAAYREQMEQFQSDPAGMRERDLEVYQIFPEGLITSGADILDHNDLAAQYRAQYGIAPDEFRVLLLGKDGGEKLRESTVLRLDRLYGTIDAMPMRRREMRGQ